MILKIKEPKHMQPIKLKYKRDFFTGLVALINELMEYQHLEDTDKLVMATLDKLKQRIEARLIIIKKEYSIALTHSEAIAMRLLYTGFVCEYKTYLGSKLHQISNQVNKTYQS